MMCSAINNPASYKIRPVIRFLYAKDRTASEIYRELCAVYSRNVRVMSEGTVRQ
jgi:hypothetical protein